MTSSLKFRGASSSSSAHQWSYDVFLSFRGKDTRKEFTAHLYDALDRNGIKTFIDDEQLVREVEVPSAVFKVIEESRIFIVVFSINYASSVWCLNELTKIVECREKKQQMVIPVFYNVDRADVRYQKAHLAESFDKHAKRFQDNPEKLERWKAVLREVSNFSGWHITYGSRDEAAVIREIVQDIKNYKNLHVARHLFPVQEPDFSSFSSPVGIESSLQESELSGSLSLVGIKSPVSSPSPGSNQNSNSFMSRHGVMLFLIASVIGLLQMRDLFETHPVNMWISVAALVIFCLSYAAMANINGTRWERYSQIIGIFRIHSGTLVAASLSSIPLPHQFPWLFYVIWAFMVFIVVAFTWICPEAEGREVGTRISFARV